jgi:hypothetical protein
LIPFARKEGRKICEMPYKTRADCLHSISVLALSELLG